MAKKKQELCSPSGGGSETPWKGRLRSHHHAVPLRIPPWVGNREEEEEATPFKRQVAPSTKNPGRCRSAGDAARGDLCRPTRARTPLRRSPRLAGRDPELRQVVIDGVSEEFQVTGSKSAMTPIRRSTQFHLDDKSSRKPIMEKESCQRQPLSASNTRKIAHDSKTKAAVSKDKKEENPTSSSRKRNAAVKPSARIKNHKEPQSLCQNSQDVPASRKDAGVSSKKSEMQELNHSHCEELTKKRKRGTGGMPTSRMQSQQDPKSLCQEIVPITEPRNTVHRKSEKDPSFGSQPKIGDDRRMNTGENNEEISGIKRGAHQQLCGSDDWTEEQDITLRQAYFTARPSPHFWKKVSKMVPGKSAEECFNRVHADLSTPTPIAPRPRTRKTNFSPLGHFTLSEPKFEKLLEPVGKQRTAKQTTLAAQKTVRHLLKKHCLMDQAQEADHFSIFETSPSALQLNISLEDSPGTPDNHLNPCSLHKYSGSSCSAPKRPLSRLKNKQAVPSPAVLKPVKNVILHEKYIDQLSRREGAKKPRKKTAGTTESSDPGGQHLKDQAGGLKAAKSALISEATDYINYFKKLQANSLAHVLENSEDGEDI